MITTLKKRFGSKQQIVNKHVDALLQLGVTSSQNVRHLRRLFDNVSSHVRSLKTLEIESTSYDDLCSVFISKLPSDLQLTLSRKVSDADRKLDTLMAMIEKEIVARERISASQTRPPTKKGDHKSQSATTLVSGSVSNAQYVVAAPSLMPLLVVPLLQMLRLESNAYVRMDAVSPV